MSKIIRKTNINMRATEQEKILLEKAANLAGFSNLTNFMMTAARREALRVINDIKITNLSEKDWDLVINLLSNPPEPNEKFKKLLENKEIGCEQLGSRKV